MISVDTITLQPVVPASGLSACPGQDVTLNCTIVRMSTLQGAVQPDTVRLGVTAILELNRMT